MALAIRLSRGGAKKRPFYRIVVADRRMPRDGRFIERVGSYNPMLTKDHKERVVLNTDRLKYWLSQGARPTDRVTRFLAQAGLGPQRVIPSQNKKNQPHPKTLERLKEKAAKTDSAKAKDQEPEITEAAEITEEVSAEETGKTREPEITEEPAKTDEAGENPPPSKET